MTPYVQTIIERRELIAILVARDLKARYRSSVLGFLWSFLNPLLMMGIYTLVFQYYMRMGWDDPFPYALYLLVGLIPWTWFASSLSEGSTSLLSGGQMLKNVRFPAEILPLVVVLANFIHFLIGLGLLAAFLLIGGVQVSLTAVNIVFFIACQFAMTFGLAAMLSGVTVFLRDMQHLLGNALTVWFFLSPIIYKADQLDHLPAIAWVFFYINPMAPVILGYQDALLYGQMPSAYQVLGSLGWSAALLGLGVRFFSNVRENLAEGL